MCICVSASKVEINERAGEGSRDKKQRGGLKRKANSSFVIRESGSSLNKAQIHTREKTRKELGKKETMMIGGQQKRGKKLRNS